MELREAGSKSLISESERRLAAEPHAACEGFASHSACFLSPTHFFLVFLKKNTCNIYLNAFFKNLRFSHDSNIEMRCRFLVGVLFPFLLFPACVREYSTVFATVQLNNLKSKNKKNGRERILVFNSMQML